MYFYSHFTSFYILQMFLRSSWVFSSCKSPSQELIHRIHFHSVDDKSVSGLAIIENKWDTWINYLIVKFFHSYCTEIG